jgi:hypothetical protein
MGCVEFRKLGEWIILNSQVEISESTYTNDIGIENKERRVVFSKNLLCESQRSSGAKGLIFN